MGITRPPYPTEFKQQMVELYRSGRTPGQLAKEFEPTEVTIRHIGSPKRTPMRDIAPMC